MFMYLLDISDYLCNEKSISWAEEIISVRRKKRTFKYQKEDRLRSFFGEILLKFILEIKLKIQHSKVNIGEGIYGKPFIIGIPHIFFSISHSGRYVLLGISEAEVGVDIEKITELDYRSIAGDYFSEDEQNYIQKSDNPIKAFFTIWTLKESFFKCIGTGLSDNMKKFSVSGINGEDKNILLKEKKYCLRNLESVPGYSMSAACFLQRNMVTPPVEFISTEEIKKYFTGKY